ncbi:MAG: class I SAM-dependent methyltransferase [Chloroflexota bacterium]
MIPELQLAVNILSILVLIAGVSWILIPILAGIPWVPTHAKRIRRALELAELKTGEIFYDLGCGDGRVLLAAARLGARAIGIEISPVHCLIARLRALLAGTWPQVSVRWGNIYRADLTDADVIFWYGYSRYDGRLKAHLERQLRDGARIVSINVDLPGWQPECVDKHDLIFLYRMPPPAGDLTSYLMQQAP